MPEYSIKNVKFFEGHDGTGFNLSLYRDGKRVARVIDTAHGGGYEYHWEDFKSQRVNVSITTDEGKPHTFTGTPEEKILYEYVETLPLLEDEYFPDGLKQNPDIFIEGLINTWEREKQMEKRTKKEFLFQVGDEIGGESFRTIKKNPNISRIAVENYIKKQFPNKAYKLHG